MDTVELRDVLRELEAIDLEGDVRRAPHRAVARALERVSGLARPAMRALLASAPEEEWTEDSATRLLTALWLRQRHTSEIPVVVTGLLGGAARRACSRYWARNPYGRRSESSGTVERDFDTFVTDTLADVCVWMAEPRRSQEAPRYYDFLDQYLAYLSRRPGRTPDPIAWLGDKARKRLRQRLLGPWYRRWAQPSLGPDDEEPEWAAPVDPLQPSMSDYPRVVQAEGKTLGELARICLSPGLTIALSTARALEDPDSSDGPVRCFLLYSAMRDFAPDERAAVAQAAGFAGKSPEAALRMQHARADRSLHRTAAALLQGHWSGRGGPGSLEEVAPLALRGLETARQRAVLEPSEAEVLGCWLQVAPGGPEAFARSKERLGLLGPAAVGKLVGRAKPKLAGALDRAMGEADGPRPPGSGGKEGSSMSLCCPKGRTYDDWLAFVARKPDVDRESYLGHLPGCDACTALLTLATREHGEGLLAATLREALASGDGRGFAAPPLSAAAAAALPRAVRDGLPPRLLAPARRPPPPARRSFGMRPVLLAGAAAAVALVALSTLRSDLAVLPDAPEHEPAFAARGGEHPAADVELLTYRITPGQPSELVLDEIGAGDRLAFAYSNKAGKGRLLVFGVDDERHVFWYHPLWQNASENPVAVPIERTGERKELPVAVRHELREGRLRIHGVFTDRAVSVRDVEELVSRMGSPSGKLSIPDAVQSETLELRVRKAVR